MASNFCASIPGHVRKAHSYAGDTPDQSGCATDVVRRTSAHVGGVTRIAGDIPGYIGGFTGIVGGTPGEASGATDLAMRPHGVSMILPGEAMSPPRAARWISGETGGVSGGAGGVSGVDRFMKYSNLCKFAAFDLFPFDPAKQNTEKPHLRPN